MALVRGSCGGRSSPLVKTAPEVSEVVTQTSAVKSRTDVDIRAMCGSDVRESRFYSVESSQLIRSAVTTLHSVLCCTYCINLDDGLERIFRHAIDTGQEITSGT